MADSTIKAYDMAGMFLARLKARDTPAMRRAVAIWLRFESGGTVVGNNPWNAHSGPKCPKERGYCPGYGNLPGQIGNRYAGPGDQNVAVFRTLQDGINVSADRLMASWGVQYGYDDVVREARQGDALGFMIALQNSAWSAGHYGHSKLVNALQSSLAYNTTVVLKSVGGSSTGPVTEPTTDPKVTEILENLKKIGFTDVSLTHVITSEEARKYIGALYGLPQEYIDNPNHPLTKRIIETWTGKTIGDVVNAFVASGGTGEPPADPLANIAGAFGSVADVFRFFLDPENWLYILALLGGVALAGYGFSKLIGAKMPISLPVVDEVSE